ncbi:hypothetical protein C8F04DRAFT_1134635 [Mycena alexandri]|uniref:Uncharacterized protein n=1 Tax=Mycena alexandri TaxID=1745969 RepID=A0AAD6SB06_9AGAR|nr:hypothetical protein C8F04DRAFT_1134635 [Mycena alexandri]
MVLEMKANLRRTKPKKIETVPSEVIADASLTSATPLSPSIKSIPPTSPAGPHPHEHEQNGDDRHFSMPPPYNARPPVQSAHLGGQRYAPSAKTLVQPNDPFESRSKSSVCLFGLPPFVTLSDLGRISRRAGASASAVMGCSFWVVRAPPPARWSLGAWIHFRSEEHARQFAAKPLLLEVRCPPTGQPEVDVFPPVDAATTLSDLWELHARTPQWSLEHFNSASPSSTMTFSVQMQQLYHKAPVRQISTTTTRWLSLRVPIYAPPDHEDTGGLAETQTEADSEHDGDAAAAVYLRALRMALGRERELAAALQRQGTEAQERARALARMKAEAQIRADFGAFGALEDVWIREVLVRSKREPIRSDSLDKQLLGEVETEAGEGEEVSTYELHALVACGEARMAERALTILPVQIPAYAESGLHLVMTPWPETMDRRFPSISASADGTTMEGTETDGAREGWARRLEREHRVQALMREREKERERQRGVAEGTWGKERLSEIRERIRRMQHRGEREMARQVEQEEKDEEESMQVEEEEPRVRSAKERKKEREHTWREERKEKEAAIAELKGMLLSGTAAVSVDASNLPSDSTSSSSDSNSDSDSESTDTESAAARTMPRADNTATSTTISSTSSESDSSSSSDSESDFEFDSAAVERSVEPITQNPLELVAGVPKPEPIVDVNAESISDAAHERDVGVGLGSVEELLPDYGNATSASASTLMRPLPSQSRFSNQPRFSSRKRRSRRRKYISSMPARTPEMIEDTVLEPLETMQDPVPEIELDAGADPSLLDPTAASGTDSAASAETSGTGVEEVDEATQGEEAEVRVKAEDARDEAKEEANEKRLKDEESPRR